METNRVIQHVFDMEELQDILYLYILDHYEAKLLKHNSVHTTENGVVFESSDKLI
jgi:hypothetical protein